ncbi:eukaryotic elongation factor 2 kinase-related [Anaeramoeba flamelloides]|uniref:Eukaryotic elongation factor 2 kinase-related n=1 Tax=Anaeramoeba flamelloides TaxID=1746091 RepID=A0AAV7YWN7_9EUKA|nr:eukaryotic elongation factor 2 kinase-related [Anaeramoeba flamelloides]
MKKYLTHSYKYCFLIGIKKKKHINVVLYNLKEYLVELYKTISEHNKTIYPYKIRFKTAIILYRSRTDFTEMRCSQLRFTGKIAKIEKFLRFLLKFSQDIEDPLDVWTGIDNAADLEWSFGLRNIVHITTENISIKPFPRYVKNDTKRLFRNGTYYNLVLFKNKNKKFQKQLKNVSKKVTPNQLVSVNYFSLVKKIHDYLLYVVKPYQIKKFPTITFGYPEECIMANLGMDNITKKDLRKKKSKRKEKEKKKKKRTKIKFKKSKNTSKNRYREKKSKSKEKYSKKRTPQKMAHSKWVGNCQAEVYYVDYHSTDFHSVIQGTGQVILKKRKKTFNIEATPFSQGSLRKAHLMTDEHKNKFVAKIMINQDQDLLKACRQELTFSYIAKKYAQKFNSRNPFKSVDFLCGFICVFEENNHINKKLFRQLSKDQKRLICNAEPKLNGKWIKFSNNYSTKVNYELFSSIYAFSHFTYHESEHKIMVADLQGIENILTDPVIHSHKKKNHFHHKTNFKKTGMAAFLSTHRCSYTCKKLGLPKNEPNEEIKLKNIKQTIKFNTFTLTCANIFCSGKVELHLTNNRTNRTNYSPHKLYFCKLCKIKNLNEYGENKKK